MCASSQVDHGVGYVIFDEAFESTFEAMTATLSRAVDTLVSEGWVAPKYNACTRLCLEEALVNAIRHGNQCQPDRQVRLEIRGAGDVCTIRVHDEGAGFQPEAVPAPDQEQLGGRGVCLMRHYMDRVAFNTAQHCLEMVFHRRRA